MSEPRTRVVLGVIVFAYCILALVYANVVPLFEAPDEVAHWEYIRFVALHHALPTEARPNFPEHIQTAGHPPLYYLLGAVIASVTDYSRYKPPQKNPYFSYGSDSLGANVFQHSAAESFPYRGLALTIQLLRGMSILFGALTIFATYCLARTLLPYHRELALGAAAVVAFIPQFIFISASINSDNLVNCLSAVALVHIVRVARNEIKFPRDTMLLGATLGLAVLSKTSALVLVPLALGAIFSPAPRAWREGLRAASLFGLTFFVVAGWWFIRNVLWFGDPLGLNWWNIAYASARRVAPLTGNEFADFLVSMWISFWGTFGWGNLTLNNWLYILIGLACGVAMMGWLVPRARNETAPRGMWVLVADVGAVILLAIWYFYSYPVGGSQGRYLFTALPSIAIFLVYGWSAYLPRTCAWLMPSIAATSLFSLSAVIPFTLLLPAYQPFHPPAPIAREQVPREAKRSKIAFNNSIRVFAFSTDEKFSRGAHARVKIYWEAVKRIASDNNVSLSLIASDGSILWTRARRPGRGHSPTNLWRAKKIIPDLFVVRVPANAPRGIAELRVSVSERAGDVWKTARGETQPVLTQVTIE